MTIGANIGALIVVCCCELNNTRICDEHMYDYHSYIRGMIHTSERSIGALQCMITLMYEPTPPPMFDGYIHTLELRCSNMHSDEYVRLYAPPKIDDLDHQSQL